MYKSGSKHKMRSAATKAPMAIKGLALIFLLCLGVRLISTIGAKAGTEQYVSSLMSSDKFMSAVLDLELGGPAETGANGLSAAIFSSAIGPYKNGGGEPGTENTASATPTTTENTWGDADGSGSLFYDISKINDQDITPETSPNPAASASPNNSFVKPDIISKEAESVGLCIKNTSSYDIDVDALFKEPLNISLTGDSPAVLIIHTHSSEAYMPDGDDQYEASDTYRTQEKAYSVIRVGDELSSEFDKRGIPVIHDRNVYDFPSYVDSYSNSYKAIQSYLDTYPSIKIVIDLHRDHIEANDGSVYKTIAQVGDTKCAQVMFVMGTGSAGLNHPNWHENLKLALHMQNEMNTLYPSLAKPIKLSEHRYNQQATTGSMIVEIGCTGNTLEEAITAARYFANAASNVILDLYN